MVVEVAWLLFRTLFHARAKHIENEQLQASIIDFQYYFIKQNPADVLIKAVTNKKLDRLLRMIGL